MSITQVKWNQELTKSCDACGDFYTVLAVNYFQSGLELCDDCREEFECGSLDL